MTAYQRQRLREKTEAVLNLVGRPLGLSFNVWQNYFGAKATWAGHKLSVHFRGRARRWFYERQPTFINFGWSDPNDHRWWSTSVYILSEGVRGEV